MNQFFETPIYVFGGYQIDQNIRNSSTSGGAFSAIVDVFCDENYAIFGAESKGLEVFHSYTFDKNDIGKYRKSKYAQSKIGTSYIEAKRFLQEGKKVLFSGTPCQVAGLKLFLQNIDLSNLLLVEVVCEGVPSPLYMRKLQTERGTIRDIDYRLTGKNIFGNGKWDFQVMRIKYDDGRIKIMDRWFNPFWSIWLNHLMSRPSCYECKFARKQRTADITLGDLWGVHLYCPELYGKNGGASVVFANTEKGKNIVIKSQDKMFGHELNLDDAIRYQAPMRKHIDYNENRTNFMQDLIGTMKFDELNRKWGKKLTLKLLWQKYIWGNRQKIFVWRLTKGNYKIK